EEAPDLVQPRDPGPFSNRIPGQCGLETSMSGGHVQQRGTLAAYDSGEGPCRQLDVLVVRHRTQHAVRTGKKMQVGDVLHPALRRRVVLTRLGPREARHGDTEDVPTAADQRLQGLVAPSAETVVQEGSGL